MEMNPRALDVLGDPTRRAIVDRLRSGPSPVGRLADGMPVSRPAVSQHLTVLKTAGLVSEHREGTRRIYRLEVAAIEELQHWVESLARAARRGRATTGAVSAQTPAAEAPAAEVAEEVVASPGRSAAKSDRPGARDDGGKKKHGKKRAGKK
jgi:DNA-binding transcriptional ArsR family regulator